MKADSILLMFHCQQFTGYAIDVLEKVFYEAAKEAGFADDSIYWSFSKLSDFQQPQMIQCEYKNHSDAEKLDQFLSSHNIKIALAFDLGYPAVVINVLKKHQVKIISYWGASMSSLNSGFKLAAKKIEWFLRSNKPDYFIFESVAMQRTATHGRGVPVSKTDVVALGVDTEKFSPAYENYFYAHQQLNIPQNKKLIFYSGHMEHRKGVHIIVQAAIEIFNQTPDYPIHFVICGNKPGEETNFLKTLKNSSAEHHLTFAGYRTDIEHLMRSSSLGVIASTGWDSFTMSSVEMMSSGLPLIVSKLQGLAETIEDKVNGFHITPGNVSELATRLRQLIDDDTLRQKFSKKSRERAAENFSRQAQIIAITNIVRKINISQSI